MAVAPESGSQGHLKTLEEADPLKVGWPLKENRERFPSGTWVENMCIDNFDCCCWMFLEVNFLGDRIDSQILSHSFPFPPKKTIC